jgi:hypothetical protein
VKPIEWSDAEREARETGRFVIVGRADGRGSRHVVWVSRWATTAAYPPEGICDRESWVSFEPLFTAEEVAERERQAAARALYHASNVAKGRESGDVSWLTLRAMAYNVRAKGVAS